nr:solute carrier family 22 member 16-like [Dermacentor andersoni]
MRLGTCPPSLRPRRFHLRVWDALIQHERSKFGSQTTYLRTRHWPSLPQFPAWLPRAVASSRASVSLAEVHAIDLLVNRRLRKRSAVMFGCWFLAFAVFFSVPASDSMHADGAVRAVVALLKMTGILVDVPIIMRAGRRRSLAFGMVGLSALSLAMAAIHLLRAPHQLLVGVVVCSVLVFDLCAVAMFLISAELYPTVVRASGLAFGYACGRLGVLASSYLADLRPAELRGAAYGFAAALLLHLGMMALGLPETTQSQPANTMRDMAAHRWALHSPLRVARAAASQGGAKRKRSRSSNRERSRAPDKSISSRDKLTR